MATTKKAAEPKSGINWILAEKNKPDPAERVLATIEIRGGGRKTTSAVYNHRLNLWFPIDAGKVIAWMPLPDPYAGK